jgi:(2Fe-2S) ferredoxin
MRGSLDVWTALQQAVASHPDLCGAVGVTTCGCLGPCFDGPSLVIYPDGVWYAGVTVDDVPELVSSHLVAGRPVDRLIYRWLED